MYEKIFGMDFVTYEQALDLKKLGFKEKCLYHYNILNEFVSNKFNIYEEDTITIDDLYDSLNTDTLSDIVCDAPTLAQAQKWFRKEKKLSIEPKYDAFTWFCTITNMNNCEWFDLDKEFKSYEEALSLGITRCLDLISK